MIWIIWNLCIHFSFWLSFWLSLTNKVQRSQGDGCQTCGATLDLALHIVNGQSKSSMLRRHPLNRNVEFMSWELANLLWMKHDSHLELFSSCLSHLFSTFAAFSSPHLGTDSWFIEAYVEGDATLPFADEQGEFMLWKKAVKTLSPKFFVYFVCFAQTCQTSDTMWLEAMTGVLEELDSLYCSDSTDGPRYWQDAGNKRIANVLSIGDTEAPMILLCHFNSTMD